MNLLRAVAMLSIFGAGSVANGKSCTYDTWDWSVREKRALKARRVNKTRQSLDAAERGPVDDCSVCSEDQRTIDVGLERSISVCARYAGPIERALTEARAAGFVVKEVIAYRVGRTKGVVDSEGLRTEFSNHSFGTAIDVNASHNGLYENCVQFGPNCRLLRGGVYDVNSPFAITPRSAVYAALKKAGFKWGGEIAGRQKDFMHFSLDGY